MFKDFSANPVTWPVHLHTETARCSRTPAYPEQPRSSPSRHALRLHCNVAKQTDTPLCQWSQVPLLPHVGPLDSRLSSQERRTNLALPPGAASDLGRMQSHVGTERWNTAGLKEGTERFTQWSTLLSLQRFSTPSSFQHTLHLSLFHVFSSWGMSGWKNLFNNDKKPIYHILLIRN